MEVYTRIKPPGLPVVDDAPDPAAALAMLASLRAFGGFFTSDREEIAIALDLHDRGLALVYAVGGRGVIVDPIGGAK